MSRIGKLPVKVPSGVKVNLSSQEIKVEGPKGKLGYRLPVGVLVKHEGDEIVVQKDEAAQKKAVALQGVTRTVIHNMIHGVSQGFEKELDIIGVGYRAAVKGKVLNLTLGFSHPVDYELPEGVTAAVEKNTHIKLASANKVLLGQVAAEIRAYRPPEPYQGKGVRYTGERIISKDGKAAGSK